MTLIIPNLAPRKSDDEERRLEELEKLRLLDSTTDGRFDRYTELATRALKMPMAAIVLVDRDRLRFKSTRGLPHKNASQQVSFASHVLAADDALVVRDASLDPRFAQHPVVRGEPHVRFYAGVPIRSQSGRALGAVCVADSSARDFSQAEADVLLQLAHLLEQEIQTHAALRELNGSVSQQLVDASTGLPSQTLFLKQLGDMLELRRRKPVVLALVRLRRFDRVHQAAGKVGTDYVVNQAATRLREASGEDSLLGHPREDLLAVAFPAPRSDEMSSVLEKLLACFHEPFVLGEHKFPTRVGIGVAMSPDDAEDAATLLKRARTALDSESGNAVTSRYRFYNRKLSVQAVRRFQIESALGEAAAKQELSLAYQPKIRCSDGTVAGAETLLRWTNDTLGAVPPSEFVPIAEESGLIVELGAWVLRSACQQLAAWTREGYACPELSINIAGDQLALPGLYDRIRTTLRDTGLEGHRLNLEVTEGSLVGDMEGTLQVMHELRGLGVRLSIDDFGKGFSSLSYLRQMPVQTLKVDRKFVENVPRRDEDAMLLKSIIAMGHALGLEVVAEGVEHEAQWQFLCKEACDQVQGFLFAPPLPAADFVSSFLARS